MLIDALHLSLYMILYSMIQFNMYSIWPLGMFKKKYMQKEKNKESKERVKR